MASIDSAAIVAVVRQRTTLATLKTAVFYYILFVNLQRAQRHLRARGVVQTVKDAYLYAVQRILLLVLRLPSMKRKVDRELSQAVQKIEGHLVPKGADVIRHLSLPHEGKSPDWILKEMSTMDAEIVHSNYRNGKLSGAVYHGGEDLEKVIVSAFEKYCVSNPLHPDAFPAIRKMEAEVVAMCLRMYGNPDGAGTTTSGGTESIIMAVKAHRDWFRSERGVTEPEIVVPISAHAAFDKAGAYLGVKVHKIPVDPETRKVNLKRLKRAINGNTVMIAGSAINFPDGCMDDIEILSQLAMSNSVGLHVDCCLGSFIMPFLEKAGYPVEPFDFRLGGVTSISCDTHKYGFAPKGSSVIMYRNADIRRYQYYVNTDWPGGLYASPSIAGSRPGSLIAGAWAAMQYMGQDGYLESCKSIVGAAKAIERAIISEIPELYVLGKPVATVVAFGSKHAGVNVLAVGDLMSHRGWHLNALSQPAAVHIACTRLTVPVVDTFVADLKDCVKEAKEKPTQEGNMVALYGLGTSSAVGPALVGKIASAFLDVLYKA